MPSTPSSHRVLIAPALALVLGLSGPVIAAEQTAAKPARAGMGRRLFKQIDTNGDGTLDQAELGSLEASQAAKADADGDGKITLSELKGTRKRMTDAGAQKLFARLDTDQDGTLTVAELSRAGEQRIARLDTNKDGKIEASELPRRQPRAAAAPQP